MLMLMNCWPVAVLLDESGTVLSQSGVEDMHAMHSQDSDSVGGNSVGPAAASAPSSAAKRPRDSRAEAFAAPEPGAGASGSQQLGVEARHRCVSACSHPNE